VIVFRAFFRTALLPLSGRQAIVSVAVLGIIAGIFLFLSFRKFANIAAIRILRRQLWGHLLGLYLFGDDPLLAVRSLFQLAKANLLLMAHTLPPLLVIAPFAALMIVHLNEFFTRTPLEHGSSTVLTVRLRSSLDHLSLEAPPWIQVDSPPVHVAAENEISWRIRAKAASHGLMRLSVGNEFVTKEVDARPAPRYFSKTRAASFAGSLLHPAEERLPSGPIESIYLSQAPSAITCLGLTMPWIAWLASISLTTAWMLGFMFSWRTHSCVQRRDSSRRMSVERPHPHEQASA
jgi:hypothetical protein